MQFTDDLSAVQTYTPQALLPQWAFGAPASVPHPWHAFLPGSAHVPSHCVMPQLPHAWSTEPTQHLLSLHFWSALHDDANWHWWLLSQNAADVQGGWLLVQSSVVLQLTKFLGVTTRGHPTATRVPTSARARAHCLIIFVFFLHQLGHV